MFTFQCLQFNSGDSIDVLPPSGIDFDNAATHHGQIEGTVGPPREVLVSYWLTIPHLKASIWEEDCQGRALQNIDCIWSLTDTKDSSSVASTSTPTTSRARGRPLRRPRNLHSAQPKSTIFLITLTCLGSSRMARTRSYLYAGIVGTWES